MDNLTLGMGFLTGNPEIAGEIQIVRQVFQMETQILIVISSPGLTTLLLQNQRGIYRKYIRHFDSFM